MIGVISKPAENWAVAEFFELFKTPWEFYSPDKQYEALVVTDTCRIPSRPNAKLLVVCSSQQCEFDRDHDLVGASSGHGSMLSWGPWEFPIYGHVLSFHTNKTPALICKGQSGSAAMLAGGLTCHIARLGYDLFREVQFLLSQGQPAENAHIPTLEIHISVFRHLLVGSGCVLVEIPPVPEERQFIACLTHDVDFVGIRDHKFDHTMWGFVYRALVTSCIRALSKELPWNKVLENWRAVFSLPLVFLGIKPDFWLEFDRYCELERDLASTFFFLPRRRWAGVPLRGKTPRSRAGKYELSDLQEQIADLKARSCEIGLHGIDAWDNAQSARDERSKLTQVAGPQDTGVRMHWLYFAERSPRALKEGGLSYDSTFGYNEAVGFRAGTAQVFALPESEDLLELPLTIQDTALFYADRMNLSDREAMRHCHHILGVLGDFGGVVTVNWHTRSLSPERQWEDFYARLLDELRLRNVWFATGLQVVNWFRQRRSVAISVQHENDRIRVALGGVPHNIQPGFRVRVYAPNNSSVSDGLASPSPLSYSDFLWRGEELVIDQNRAAEVVQ